MDARTSTAPDDVAGSVAPIESFRAGKARLLAELATVTPGGIDAWLRKLARHADAVLRRLWTESGLGPARSARPGPTFAPVLIAVGGYGRGELHPHSDIDLLILLPDGADAAPGSALAAAIETFVGRCWDAGLEVGTSVRTLAECAAQAAADVTVQTALLEARRLTGSPALHQRFKAAYDAAMDPRAFLVAKTLEMRQRHHKYEDTPYALEPNCKESPGGLRDLQVILWVARAAGFGTNWMQLADSGLATTFEARQLRRNQRLLSLIRARLHLVAGRREDRLVFDLQTAVAERFGFGNVVAADGRIVSRASEALMKRYYWAAKAVTQLNLILLLNIERRLNPPGAAPTAIDDDFQHQGGLIDVRRDDLYATDPTAILRTFLVFQTTPGARGLSARTLRALYHARRVMNDRFRADPANHATFKAILEQPTGITHAMRLMNQTSVLGRYLWVFRRIVGQMQHDLFHVYTVDQHILMVLRNVRRFFMPEHAHEYPFCSELAGGWDRPWLLYVAALFHDIAKGRGGDHSELGAREVKRFCRQHAIGADDAKLIEFLVREHLTMSQVAQKQDLGDAEVIRAFAGRVGNPRQLTALYLLTVADIRGTSPKVWNAWKGKLLEDLFRSALRTLGGRAPDLAAEVEATKAAALVQLALETLPHDAHKSLWETLDVGYFMRHDAGEIAWHTRHVTKHQAQRAAAGGAIGRADAITRPLVRARQSPVGEGLQVMVFSPDQPDLFARICGYFDQAGFSILDARIHTTRNGFALDTFQVVSGLMAEHSRELTSMVESELALTLEKAGPLPPPSRGRVSRRVRSFPAQPHVQLHPDERAQRWLLSVSASDRTGLLYSIARVLARHHINLQLAKVSTLGERVEDTFLVDGAELQQNRRQIEIETELLEVLAD